MKVSLQNLNEKNFRSTETKLVPGGSAITPSYFAALMNMAIFHNTRDRTDYNHAFCFKGFMM
jgi:hypothetical protein